ncbi:L-histidine N(alpha)-methyltransferase [Maricaulis parjimensis]|uniref:L-histidine N(alpha)-methyltransferase n=1 Tax=Maricaulis parjimensis TaxID=144023 RepID=UPI001939EFA8|nr:L-histidine N(alpha)-methyltransferase [Maricaulis parjimensis]
MIHDSDFAMSALEGLQASPKWLDSKWLYDTHGSAIFEQITQLPEYYPTRTETGILKDQIDALSAVLEPGQVLVELGSGASVKTRILLDAASGLRAYVPVDISADFLEETAEDLRKAYPDTPIRPVVADFTGEITLPQALDDAPKTAFFPGSTIGNLPHDTASAMLDRLSRWPGIEALILGLDLVKDTATLVDAYDDQAGVTADFNLNLLRRMNREIGADFDLSAFRHEARWNAQLSRIEMHLVSERAQTVTVAGQAIRFAKGESIHTENSRKYTREGFAAIADRGGWEIADFLTDTDQLFAVAVLRPKRA